MYLLFAGNVQFGGRRSLHDVQCWNVCFNYWSQRVRELRRWDIPKCRRTR